MSFVTTSIESYLESVIKDIIDEQSEKGIVSSGKSAQSLSYIANVDGGKIFGSSYFKQQQEGRKPGRFPSLTSIQEWIVQKGIQPQGISIESLAFLIARKIARQGTDIFLNKRPGLSIRDIAVENLPELSEELLKGTFGQIKSVI